MDQSMEKDFTNSQMVLLMKAILSKICFKGKEFWLSPEEFIKDRLFKDGCKEGASLSGKISLSMKDNIKIIANTVEENIFPHKGNRLKGIG